MSLNRLLIILSVLVLLGGGGLFYLYSTPSKDDQQLQAGLEAFNKTEYRKAYKLWLPLAQSGHSEAQGNISALYLSGHGLSQNFVLAYVWIRLAEYNGAKDTDNIMRIVKSRLSTQELSEAEEIIQNCIGTHYRECR